MFSEALFRSQHVEMRMQKVSHTLVAFRGISGEPVVW